ncbi:flagellar hook assembly protein FlgD [Kistimonas asteriae]|uniref:flagellar hook assembly protein FlgD n=1 Tax=Kistimonas asteriae TaxID=517724 RepID=UPI001BA6EFFB|nr:flagellar hook capping FlgD N-terminal domain-containing protein [Kistimonas asteriae]
MTIVTEPLSGSGLMADTASRPGKAEDLGKQDFMKLLVAQIRNQDPLNPSDSTQMVTQLAQFAGVESLADIRSSMHGMDHGLQVLQAAGFAGRRVTVNTDQLVLSRDSRDIAIEVDTDAQSGNRVTIMLTDGLGQPAAVRELSCAGRDPARFSLKEIGGESLPDGVYFVSAASEQAPLPVAVNSRVNSVSLSADQGETLLQLAGVGSVPASFVRRIE